MSTSVNPSAEPSQAPVPVAPKPAAAPPEAPGHKKIWLTLALVASAGIAAYFLKPQPAQKKSDVAISARTAKIAAGTLDRTIRIAGSTSAGRFANISAPMLRGPDAGRSLTLVFLAKSGTIVKKDSVVAQIDTTAAKDHIDDVKAIVQTSESDIAKKKADQAIEEENLRQNLRLVKSNLDKAKLDLAASEVRTPIDQEQLKLSVEEYETEYKETEANFKIALESNRIELKLLDLTKARHLRHLDRHVVDMERFTIKTPMDGLAVMLSVYRGGDMGQIREGDTVAPNQAFMRIVDPKSIQLDAMVNQVESEWIRIGQPVTLAFDAFPGLSLKGKVFSIGALAVGGWRANYYIRNIPVKVVMLEQHPKVIPDLSACADVLIERREDSVLVPLEAVRTEGGKTVVHVKEGDHFGSLPVELGLANNTHAVAVSGLKPGQEVILRETVIAADAKQAAN